MAYENLCMYCFKDMGGETVCPHCGGDSRAAVPQIQLLPGTLVYRQRFLVGRALGQDSGGIVYNALDTKRGGVIRIREYLPRNCAERLNDGNVVPVAGMEDAFETGMRKLHASVESPEDPRQRHFYFEENGTAYIAQRKNVSAAAAEASGDDFEDEEDEGDRRKQILLYVAIAAAVVVAVAIVAILFFNSLGAPGDETADNPPELSDGATWSPEGTPTPEPSPSATATFAALVDPELSWLEYTDPGEVSDDLKDQLSGEPTKKPALEGNENYPTINAGSDEADVRELQNRLVQLGWLNYSSVSGKYDNATKSAVREFQKYVNEHCSPAVKLVEDGIAGKKTQQWLYDSNVSLLCPTPTPAPKVTAAPDAAVVDENSSASDIRDLQRKLIALGLMPEGSADGKFGAATRAAIESFQRQVNRIQGYVVLPMDGVADALTRAWLNYYAEDWKILQSATAVPESTATPAPASDRVDASASSTRIREVQRLLRQVELLDSGDIDGIYGVTTADAVRKFQSWINELRGEQTLEVSGAVDSLTERYLQYCVDNGRSYGESTANENPEPDLDANPGIDAEDEPGFEPEPQEQPDPTEVPPEQQAGADGVTPDSPTESIQFMQEMLSEVGLLDAEHISGSYDAETQVAVRAFQIAANERFDAGLEVSGNCDTETLRYLQQCYDDGEDLSQALAAPTPTEAPTAVPPIDGVATYSSEEDILEMQTMLFRVRLLEEGQITGVYDGPTTQAIRSLQKAANLYNKKEVLQVTGNCDSRTLEYLRIAAKRKLNLRKLVGTPEPTVELSASPEISPDASVDPAQSAGAEDAANPADGETPDPFAATPEPVAELTPEPVATPTPEASPEITPLPSVQPITALHFAISGGEVSGRVELSSGGHEITWGVEGQAQSYYVYLYDGSQNLIRKEENTDITGFSMNTRSMHPGEVYELRVGALPLYGSESDILWQSIQLVLPEEVTPEPTVTPTPAPTLNPPVINLGSSAYQRDGVQYVSGGSAIFSWMATGVAVKSYTVDLTYEADGTDYSLGTTTDTSRTINTAQLRPGTYLLRVGATPEDGSPDDTVWSELRFAIPEPEATPEPVATATPEPVQREITYLDANSDAEDIETVQMALYGQGLLDASSAQAGVLDRVTLDAIVTFQQRVNAVLGANLMVLDPDDGNCFVDSATLDMLLNQNINLSGQ